MKRFLVSCLTYFLSVGFLTLWKMDKEIDDHVPEKWDLQLLWEILNMIFFIVFQALANFLLFCMIYFERNGMDVQKRTVTNQLLSSVCGSLMIFNILFLPFIYLNRVMDIGKSIHKSDVNG